MTLNSCGKVAFDGVCTNLSNAAYPVERVQEMVVPEVPKERENLCVHLALSLIHEGIVEETDDGYSLSYDSFSNEFPSGSESGFGISQPVNTGDSSRETIEDSEVINEICDRIDLRVTDPDSRDAKEDFAEFVTLLKSVLNALTQGEWTEEAAEE